MDEKKLNADFMVEELTDRLESISLYLFDEGAGAGCAGCMNCATACYEPPHSCASCMGCPGHSGAACPVSLGPTPRSAAH